MALPAALVLTLSSLASCGGPEPLEAPAASDPRVWIDVTIGGIPEADRGLLVLPQQGFVVDVRFPRPEDVLPQTLSVSARPWSGGPERVLRSAIAERSDGAALTLPPGHRLATGSHTIWATVERSDGGRESVSLPVAVRQRQQPPPLSGGQWIQLDFEADRDADGIPDFPTDLAVFGLAGGLSPAADIRMEAWVIDQIVKRTGAFYRANPSRLPGGDPLALRFSARPRLDGPYSRICVAGATPGEDPFIGNVLLDPGNRDRADEACDDYLPSGVFPRELTHYADEPGYRAAFGPLLAEPPGSLPLDVTVLGPRYDPNDPEQRARRADLERGVSTFAQVVASVIAHEAGHAMGLVPPGPPGVGLYGGSEGVDFTHNLTADGEAPRELLLMNTGPSFGFDDLAGSGEHGLPRLRALNFAYLQGRVLLDPEIDAIHPPPRVDAVDPNAITTDGALLPIIEIHGADFLPAARVVLRGPSDFPVLHIASLEGQDGAPDTLIGQVLAPTLLTGRYGIEVTNPDGQTAILPAALEVR